MVGKEYGIAMGHEYGAFPGIDIRTEIASRNLAAILSNPAYTQVSRELKVDSAVQHADLMLAQLDR